LTGEGKENDDFILVTIMAVNHDFIETLGIEMREGRRFSRDIGADTARVIFNEAAIEVMGFKDPIGKKARESEIIGVVKNFHFESFHTDVKPQLFILHRGRFAPPSLIMARIDAERKSKRLSASMNFTSPTTRDSLWITDSLTKTTRGSTYPNNAYQHCRDILAAWQSSSPAWDCSDSPHLPHKEG
jgi:hypothetical protein